MSLKWKYSDLIISQLNQFLRVLRDRKKSFRDFFQLCTHWDWILRAIRNRLRQTVFRNSTFFELISILIHILSLWGENRHINWISQLENTLFSTVKWLRRYNKSHIFPKNTVLIRCWHKNQKYILVDSFNDSYENFNFAKDFLCTVFCNLSLWIHLK